MMRRPIRYVTILIAVAVAGVSAYAATFNAEQRNEIGSIVREYMLNNPELLREVLQELEKKEAAEDGAKLKVAIKDNADQIFRSSLDLVAGNPNGNVTMVEFFDYNCGYCKRAMPDVMRMVEEDGDLKLVMKEFPILGPGSLAAAKAALASKKQGKYLDFHLAMLGHEGHLEADTVMDVAKSVGLDIERLKADMASEDVGNILEANMELAQKLGIQGTPAFVVDETLIPGAIGYEGLSASVRQVRDQGGCKVC
ncbi:MAG: thioredoxin domain-containing protein [Rhizobiales bacterium]|nr:thioredoxin domain-containing protein [Hyphomicrobiales bacterium]